MKRAPSKHAQRQPKINIFKVERVLRDTMYDSKTIDSSIRCEGIHYPNYRGLIQLYKTKQNRSSIVYSRSNISFERGLYGLYK